MLPHLKDPTYNFPLSFFFLQEKRTIVIKVEALGGPGRMVITMCLEDNQAADSVSAPNAQQLPSCNALIKTCLPAVTAGSSSEPKPRELQHLGIFSPEPHKHWCTYQR